MKVKGSSLTVVLTGIAGGSLLASYVLYAFWSEWRGPNVPLHSTMEALGSLAAIVMARVLFQRGEEGQDRTKFQALALGFLGMGLLQGFHAVSSMGNGFIFLRGVASLIGALGFLLACLPKSERQWVAKKELFWSLTLGSLAFGLTSLLFPDSLPEMIRNGEFSPTAVAPTSLASLLFLGAAVRFFVAFRRSGQQEDYLFACLSLLFGLAEVMFTYSRMWDSVWWLWHLILLTAYLWVLGYLSRDYLQTISGLRVALAQTKRAEEAMRQSEQQLRTVLEERERISRDLHDGIIQSIYAIGLSLNGCRRLLGEQPKAAAQPLTQAIDDLNVVIRDVRNYIIGLEPQVTSPEELEASLASMVRMMGADHAPSFSLTVDPQAAKQLNSEQALHLLYIAREAMSNSLRHSQARCGSVLLQLREDAVRLQVMDEGIGFDPTALLEQGQGLRNIRARSQKLGARYEVISSPGKGTQVVLDIPLENTHAAT
jgi:signal transduction histidine kinase